MNLILQSEKVLSMYCAKGEFEKLSLKREFSENTNSADVFGRALQGFKGKVYDSIVSNVGEYKEKLATAADLENEAIDMAEREIASWRG